MLIIGAGIGGLCLAQGLKKHGIPFTVFERDPTPSFRTQGYRLRITPEGYDALVANLPSHVLELFHKSTAAFAPGPFSFLDAHTAEALPPAPGRGPPPAPSSSTPSPVTTPTTNAGDADEAATADHSARKDTGAPNKPQPWTPPPHTSANASKVFTADRLVLRSVLLTDLSEHELQFGMAFKHYDTLADGHVQVTFKNGCQAVGSVLVGCDGTHSRVRKQYIPHATQLLDTDGRAIYGKTLLTPALEAALPTSMLQSTTLVASAQPHASLFIEPVRFVQGDPHELAPHLPSVSDYMYWVLIARSQCFMQAHDKNESARVDRAATALSSAIAASTTSTETATTATTTTTRSTDRELFALSPHQVAELSCQMTAAWHSSIRALLEHQERSLCSLLGVSTMSPKMQPWQSSGVTLLGDAIHAMTPAGIGANVALQDARVLLASLLARGVGADAVGAYEQQMRVYAVDAITSSAGAGKKMYGQPGFDGMRPVAQQ